MSKSKGSEVQGQVFKGWLVGEKLGNGGNGTVFLATRDDQEAAIKFLHPKYFDERRGKRFRDWSAPRFLVHAK